MTCNQKSAAGFQEMGNDSKWYFSKSQLILLATHVNISFYAACFWIQLGVLPYLTKRLGVDTTTFGYLQTTFSFVQLCGGPLYGRFGDLFGARYALLLAFAAASLSYGMLAVAETVLLLFLSRLPSVFMHGMQGSQMVVTDVTCDSERAASFAHLGIAYGAGMVIGPVLGGLITDRFSEPAAALASAVGSMLSIIIVVMTIPHDTKSIAEPMTKHVAEKKSDSGLFDVKKIVSILQTKSVAYLLIVKIISGMPIGIMTSMFSVIVMDQFHLSAKENGYVLSFFGLVSIVVQGFGINALTSRFDEVSVINYSVVSVSLSFLLLAFTSNILIFISVLVPMVAGGAVLQIIVNSVITKAVSSRDTGSVLGLSMATHSLIRSISPTIGGWLFFYFGLPSFGMVGFLVNSILACYLLKFGKRELDSHL